MRQRLLTLPAGRRAKWVVMLVWLVALVQGCRWFVRHPVAVLALSVVLALGWFATVIAGARWLGWTSP